MVEPDDPYGPALGALKAAGLIPRPITGYRFDEVDDQTGIGVLQHRGPLSAEERGRISLVMGDLSYVLDEVVTEPDGTERRAADGRVLGQTVYRRGPN